MLSSISSSKTESADLSPLPGIRTNGESNSARRATITLIVALTLLLAGTEIAARFLFPRYSRIQRRVEEDRHSLTDLRGTSVSPPIVLLLGNSLLLHGLNYSKIRTELSTVARPVRYVIENTEYVDWYYGINHLFAEGIKPATVVLCLNLGQFLSNKGLGDYSSRYLFGAGDVLPAARDSGFNNTETAELVLSHWSAFYSSRAMIRNYLLNIADPGYAAALHGLAQVPPVFPPDVEEIAQSRIRLRALNDLCRRHGARFVLLVPPALTNEGEALVKAGALEHVDVAIPVSLGSLGPEFYRDRFHLNEKGAEVFTKALEREILTRQAPERQSK
jgi:hypothetical protein